MSVLKKLSSILLTQSYTERVLLRLCYAGFLKPSRSHNRRVRIQFLKSWFLCFAASIPLLLFQNSSLKGSGEGKKSITIINGEQILSDPLDRNEKVKRKGNMRVKVTRDIRFPDVAIVRTFHCAFGNDEWLNHKSWYYSRFFQRAWISSRFIRLRMNFMRVRVALFAGF